MTQTIIHTDTFKGIQIKVLKYENESLNALDLSILTEVELELIHSFKSEKRQLEFYYARFLWKTFEINESIDYQERKPFLNDGHISISHSNRHVAVAYSPHTPIGIDLEEESPQIELIKRKFIHPTERVNSLSELCQIWTIKEAIYKWRPPSSKLSFKNDMLIQKLTSSLSQVKVLEGESVFYPEVISWQLDGQFHLSLVH